MDYQFIILIVVLVFVIGFIGVRWYRRDPPGPELYPNLCLTDRPYYNKMCSLTYWRNLPKLLELQYQSCHSEPESSPCSNGQIPQPRCMTLAPSTHSVSLNPQYYPNSQKFCHRHPRNPPCPNFWRSTAKTHGEEVTCRCPASSRRCPVVPMVPQQSNPYGINIEPISVSDGLPTLDESRSC